MAGIIKTIFFIMELFLLLLLLKLVTKTLSENIPTETSKQKNVVNRAGC